MGLICNSKEVGKMHITVDAEFRISDSTAHTCVQLLSMFARQNGWDGLIIDKLPDDNVAPFGTFSIIENRKEFEESIYNYVKSEKEMKGEGK